MPTARSAVPRPRLGRSRAPASSSRTGARHYCGRRYYYYLWTALLFLLLCDFGTFFADGGIVRKPSDFTKNRRGASPETKRELWLNAQKALRKKEELPFPPKAWHMKRWPHHPKTCYDGHCFYRNIVTKATMSNENLMFCNGCPNPHESGSQANLWNAHFSLWRYQIDAELVMAVPNDASSPLLNEYQVYDAVAVVKRGAVSILEKIKHAQEAGAVAILIIDDGECTPDFRCRRLGEKAEGVGFAWGDRWENWLGVYIPTFLVTKQDGDRLLNAMPVQEHDIPGFGTQLVHIDEHNEL